MTYNDYIDTVENTVGVSYWRQGQTYLNVLHRIRPDLADQIRGGPLDPFHRNDAIPEFLSFVQQHWEQTA